MLRLALIGCGRNAAAYVTAAGDLRNAEFSAVADPDAGRADSVARALGAEHHAATLAELLEASAESFDAAIINTPNDSHAQLTESAAAAGKHVLAEKPLATSYAAALGAVDACSRAGVRLMVAHSLRYTPALRTVKLSLDDGELGRPGLLRIHRWMPLFPGDRTNWKLDPSRNGGLSIHEAVHEIDLALWMFDALPERIYARARNARAGGMLMPDYLQIHLGFDAGGMSLIDLALTLPHGDRYFSLTLVGSLGTAYADDHHNMQLVFGGGNAVALKTEPHPLAVAEQVQEFVDAVDAEREPAIPGRAATAALLVAEAVHTSVETGRALVHKDDGYEPV